MGLFETGIDRDFVHAVQSIAKELKELNKNLKENKSEKKELTTQEKNIIWHEVEDAYNTNDAKIVAENLFSGTYLYDILTDSDWCDIVTTYQDRHDMTLADWDQWETVIEGTLFDKHFADYDDETGTPNWVDKPFVVCIGTDNDQISDLNEYFAHLEMNGYNVIRITDCVAIIDGEHLSYATTCAKDRNLAFTSCSIELPESWHFFSGIGLKQKCIDALLQSYTNNLDYVSEEEQQKILEGIKTNLSRCSKEGEA
jgi:hypothetical protein